MTPALLEEYRTGFVASGGEEDQPAPPYCGRGWSAYLIPQSGSHRSSGVRGNAVYDSMEIAVRAHSWVAAQRAVDLIDSCRLVISGDPDIVDSTQTAFNATQPDWMAPEELSYLAEHQFHETSHLPLACALAARVSTRRRWIYAVAKYKFSVGLFGIHHMDMQPNYGTYHPISSHVDDHVRFCHAIMAAHGVLEDLGLDVPAGPGRPSRTAQGTWNPEVKAVLDDRLRSAGVNAQDSILWTVRGPARRIERARPLPIGTRPTWDWGPIRDIQIAIPDAISYSSFLRDRVAAHNVKRLTSSLSPYDVVNVQHLARFLFLASLDYRVWEPTRLRFRHGVLVWHGTPLSSD